MMMDPKHPDVAPVQDLLDDCETCCGEAYLTDMPCAVCDDGTGRGSEGPCPCCNGTGKALHPDRVAGALKRWLWASGSRYSEGDNTLSNYSHIPSAFAAGRIYQLLGTAKALAIAYCLAVQSVRERDGE